MSRSLPMDNPPNGIRKYAWGLMAVWTVIIAASLFWNCKQLRSEALEMARTEARAGWDKDVLYRRWNTSHGGVYVPVSAWTPPNPYLSPEPERDIVTPSGRPLTLMNPAYMTRQVYEMASTLNPIRGRITSLRPLNPANAPDPWEKRALEAIHAGSSEVSSVEELHGGPVLRLMKPFMVEKGCLKCHAVQGYVEGDVRGGISITVPLESYLASVRRNTTTLSLWHGLFLVLGFLGVGIGAVGLERNMAQFRKAQDAVRAGEEKYRLLLQNAGDAVLVHEIGPHGPGRFMEVNEQACHMLGYTREELLSMEIPDIDVPEQEARLPEILAELRTKGSVLFETEHRAKDGRRIPVEVSVRLFDLGGRPTVFSVVRDISERKRAETQLRETEEKYRMVVENAGEIILVVQEGIIRYANPKASEVVGIPVEELKSRPVEDLIHPEDRALVLERHHRRSAGEEVPQTYAFRVVDTTGNVKWVEINAVRVLWENAPATLNFFTEITHRVRAEENLRRSESRLRSVIRVTPVGIGLVADRVLKDANTRLCEMTGYSRDELLDVDARLLYPSDEDYRYVGFEKYRQIREQGTGTVETRWQRRDGRIIDVLLSSTPMDENDWSRGVIFTALDITDRKRAEDALRESEERLSTILEALPMGVVIVDQQTHLITDLNPAMARMIGAPRERIIGQACRRFLCPEEGGPCPVTDLCLEEDSCECSLRTETGTEIPVLKTVCPVTIGGRGYLLEVLMDIRERRNLEDQLRQAQKMEAVGRLAGGVAHDFNNMLSPILGYAEMLLADLPSDDPRRRQVQQIKKAAERSRDLTRQLLAFSRKQVLELKVVDLQEIVRSMERLLRHTLRENIELETVISCSSCKVVADVGQIEQILLNLAVNAQDAMPDGGRLTIEVAGGKQEDAFCGTPSGLVSEHYGVLIVSDTGIGMDEETKGRIFEPFFSTKGEGGTGLGLATVYGIVQQHGGNILVQSEPEKGATFKVYLPAVPGERLVSEKRTGDSAVVRGSETVLLVEDNEMVRGMVRSMLEHLGYGVLEAASGRAALDLLAHHSGPLDLLLTDVVMPDMNGKELYTDLSRHYPRLKALFMSGYTDDVIGQHGVLEEGVNFIQKPFTVEALASKIRQAVGGQ